MPGCAVHLELASRVLQAWRDRPTERPFPPDDPACHAAFLTGSLAPDFGYYPGGDRLCSDLAHYLRPSSLARCLIATAETQVELALGWGWTTHLLADVWIHPLVNEAVADRVRGCRRPVLTFADDAAAHVSVETGLDAWLPARAGWPESPTLAPLTDSRAFAAITRAYEQTYRLAPHPEQLRRVHRTARRIVPLLLLGGKVVSRRPAGRWARWVHRGLARVPWRGEAGGLLTALLNPTPAPDWLLDEVGAVADTFAERFAPYVATQLAGMPEFNLDTGEQEPDPPVYVLSVATRAELKRRAGSRPIVSRECI